MKQGFTCLAWRTAQKQIPFGKDNRKSKNKDNNKSRSLPFVSRGQEIPFGNDRKTNMAERDGVGGVRGSTEYDQVNTHLQAVA
jgi:hypothetical protein